MLRFKVGLFIRHVRNTEGGPFFMLRFEVALSLDMLKIQRADHFFAFSLDMLKIQRAGHFLAFY